MKKVSSIIGKVLVLDLETSGLPTRDIRKTCGHVKDNIKYYDSCRIMSICYGVFDNINKFSKDKLSSYLISHSIDYKPDPIALNVNGLDKQTCNEVGVSINSCGIIDAINSCDTIMSYNVAFDYNVLMSELLRYNTITPNKNAFCMMEYVKTHHKLNKNIKLIDACGIYLDTSKYDFHDATDDVTAMCDLLLSMEKN